MNTEEIQLVNGVLLGDRMAADQFVRQYSRFIYSVIHECRLEPADANDIYQRVFVRLWSNQMRALRMWTGTGSFLTYLRPIVRNIVVDELRARPPAASPVEPDIPAGRPLVEPSREAVHAALGKLAPRDRELIRLKHFEGLSYREIGERLGLTVNNVGVSLSRAEDRLRRILEGHV